MYKKAFLWLFALIAVCWAGSASAQTISIVSGNGQLICQQCANTSRLSFDPLVVKVVDASGRPVAGATVTWAVTSGGGTLNLTSSITGTDGTSSNNYTQFATSGTILNPYTQSTISASIGTSAVTFYETLALTDINNLGVTPILININAPGGGNSFTGASGTTDTRSFTVTARTISGQPVANIGVLLAPTDPNGPTVACASTNAAQPGLVLTDSTGNATCAPVYGGRQGTGSFVLVVGGVASSANNFQNPNGPYGYAVSTLYSVTVTAGQPAGIVLTSGNNQTINPGQSLGSLLTATVTDAAGSPISGAQVTWSVTPANAATLSQTVTTSGSNGQVSTNLTLNAAAGSVQVTAALATNPNAKVTFTVTANVVVTGLQKVSGDQQDAALNTSFASPLVVQVSTSSGGVAGVPVQFAVTSGSGTLAASSATTDSNGRAQVSVTAGPNTGALVVTATAGTQSVPFNLTVRTPGPTVSSSNVMNGVSFQRNSLSPCSIGYLTGTNLAPGLQGVTQAPPAIGPSPAALPIKLQNVTIQFGNSFAPLFYVSNQGGVESVAFQVPCEVIPGTVQMTVGVGGGQSTVSVQVQAVSPAILSWTDPYDNKLRGVLVRPDGTFVSMPNNPARRGEIIRMYATGLGPTVIPMKSGQTATDDPDSAAGFAPTSQIIVGVNNQGVRLVSARYAPNLIGLYEIAFEVPADAQTGDTVLAIGVVPQGGSIVYSQSPAPTIPVQ